MLNEEEAVKLAKIFGMLASDYEAEQLVAIRKMRQLLARHKLTMHDLAAIIEALPSVYAMVMNGTSAPQPEKQSSTVETVRDAVDFCYGYAGNAALSERESEFVESVHGQFYRGRELSQKQLNWLKAITRKLMRTHGYQGAFHDVA